MAEPRFIQSWLEEERERCAKLVELWSGDKFLVYCIRNVIAVDEVEEHRQRFYEFQPPTVDIEDLM